LETIYKSLIVIFFQEQISTIIICCCVALKGTGPISERLVCLFENLALKKLRHQKNKLNLSMLAHVRIWCHKWKSSGL